MDFADHGRDDHYKEFAARASAECLLWFFRERVPTETIAGFDDLLTPGTARLPDAPAPSMLLNARYGVVPWHEAGRSEILASLDAWADDPSYPVAVRLLHAEGGVGKTRLAIEWVRRRRGRYDLAGFLVPAPDTRWLERLCGFGPPVMVVIDYAESCADLVAVLQRVAAFGASTGPHRRVCVLLLARNDGDWWKSLPQRSLEIAELLEGREPINLLPLATTTTDRGGPRLELPLDLSEIKVRHQIENELGLHAAIRSDPIFRADRVDHVLPARSRHRAARPRVGPPRRASEALGGPPAGRRAAP